MSFHKGFSWSKLSIWFLCLALFFSCSAAVFAEEESVVDTEESAVDTEVEQEEEEEKIDIDSIVPTVPSTVTEAMAKAKLDKLIALLDGLYFTTNQQSAPNVASSCLASNVANSDWFQELLNDPDYPVFNGNFFPSQYITYNYRASAGAYNGYSCFGFACFAQYYLYSQTYTDNLVGQAIYCGPGTIENIKKYARCGDIIRFGDGNGHSVVFYSVGTGTSIMALDSNWYSDCSVHFGKRDLSILTKGGTRYMTISRPTNADIYTAATVNQIDIDGPKEEEIVLDEDEDQEEVTENSVTEESVTEEETNALTETEQSKILEYRVTNGPLNVRSGPGMSYGILNTLTEGTELSVLAVSADQYWIKIESGNISGWVFKQYTTIIDKPVQEEEKEVVQTGYRIVSAQQGLNLREGAGTSYKVITILPGGSQITVLGANEEGTWLQVKYGSYTGWVSERYTMTMEEAAKKTAEEKAAAEKAAAEKAAAEKAAAEEAAEKAAAEKAAEEQAAAEKAAAEKAAAEKAAAEKAAAEKAAAEKAAAEKAAEEKAAAEKAAAEKAAEEKAAAEKAAAEELAAEAAKISGGLLSVPYTERVYLCWGSTGSQVTLLQKALTDLDYTCTSENGVYGNLTYSAVLSFQNAKGLKADGCVGQQTWAALYEAIEALGDEASSNQSSVNSSTVDYLSFPTVSWGSSNSYVKILQEQLAIKGYDCSCTDGVFGNSTYMQVLAFQKANGLVADGVVGRQTWAALFN